MLKKVNLSLLMASGVIGALAWHKLAQPSTKNTTKITLKNQVPTVFIHGYAGTRLSAGLMIKRFECYGWGQKSAVITIKADGSLVIKGDPEVPGALIQVLFDSNRMPVMHQTNWLWRLMNCLRNHHSIEHVNVVAHSMGGVSVLDYLSKYGSSRQVAHVDKVVTLGVPFNDLEVGRDGKEIEYRPLTKYGPLDMTPLFRNIKRHRYLISPETAFLNIAGDLKNGTASDGTVSVDSALSLRYLLGTQPYYELIVTAKRASHSMLHENKEVDRAIGQFLIGKRAQSVFEKN